MVARVLIVEDSIAFARGLRAIIEDTGEFEILEVLPVAERVLDKVRDLHPDIVVVDLHIASDMHSQPAFHHGIALIQAIHSSFPEIPILATSFVEDGYWLRSAVRAGASGYVNKDATDETFIEALRALREGRVAFTREQMKWLRQAAFPLTKREMEVLDCLARGMSNAEIARALHIAEGTVRTHVSRILHKLDVRNRHEAIEEARRRGLI